MSFEEIVISQLQPHYTAIPNRSTKRFNIIFRSLLDNLNTPQGIPVYYEFVPNDFRIFYYRPLIVRLNLVSKFGKICFSPVIDDDEDTVNDQINNLINTHSYLKLLQQQQIEPGSSIVIKWIPLNNQLFVRLKTSFFGYYLLNSYEIPLQQNIFNSRYTDRQRPTSIEMVLLQKLYTPLMNLHKHNKFIVQHENTYDCYQVIKNDQLVSNSYSSLFKQSYLEKQFPSNKQKQLDIEIICSILGITQLQFVTQLSYLSSLVQEIKNHKQHQLIDLDFAPPLAGCNGNKFFQSSFKQYFPHINQHKPISTQDCQMQYLKAIAQLFTVSDTVSDYDRNNLILQVFGDFVLSNYSHSKQQISVFMHIQTFQQKEALKLISNFIAQNVQECITTKIMNTADFKYNQDQIQFMYQSLTNQEKQNIIYISRIGYLAELREDFVQFNQQWVEQNKANIKDEFGVLYGFQENEVVVSQSPSKKLVFIGTQTVSPSTKFVLQSKPTVFTSQQVSSIPQSLDEIAEAFSKHANSQNHKSPNLSGNSFKLKISDQPSIIGSESKFKNNFEKESTLSTDLNYTDVHSIITADGFGQLDNVSQDAYQKEDKREERQRLGQVAQGGQIRARSTGKM